MRQELIARTSRAALSGSESAVIYRKTDQLSPLVRNARTHSPAQVRQIAQSTEKFGFTNSLLIDQNDTVVTRNGRLFAAQLLKLREVPMISLGQLSLTGHWSGICCIKLSCTDRATYCLLCKFS